MMNTVLVAAAIVISTDYEAPQSVAPKPAEARWICHFQCAKTRDDSLLVAMET